MRRMSAGHPVGTGRKHAETREKMGVGQAVEQGG